MAKRKTKGQKVFNDRPRKVFRKTIPNVEVVFGAIFVGVVVLMGLWFIGQRSNFDPAERDISMEIMLASSVQDKLYEPPLKLWIDPALAVAGSAAAPPDIGIMPDTIVQGGWMPSSRLEVFDHSNLYEKIDGQEVQYKSYGFQFLHFISVSSAASGLDANIEIYDMAEFANALGVFAAQRSEGRVVRTLDSGAIGYETEAGVIALIGQFYVKLSGSENSPLLRALGWKFVNAFAAENAGEVESPRPLRLLTEGLGVDFGGIEYLREDVFQYAFAKEFWFGRKDEGKHTRHFIHETSGDAEAAELVSLILDEHDYDYSPVSAEGGVTVLMHDFLKTYFAISHVGPFVIGVERAKIAEDAAAGVAKLEEIVWNEIAGEDM